MTSVGWSGKKTALIHIGLSSTESLIQPAFPKRATQNGSIVVNFCTLIYIHDDDDVSTQYTQND